MNKKILAAVIVSLTVLTSFVGLAQTKQVSAYIPTRYQIEIKVTKMNLYDDGDTIGKGELYLSTPSYLWSSGDSYKYDGGFHREYLGTIFLDYYVNTYDITARGVSSTTILDDSPVNTYTYTLMDKDLGADDQLFKGKVSITGTTDGWVYGWSGAQGSTKTLAGGNVEIQTEYTRWDTYEFRESTNFGTVYTWWKTFTNQLYFGIRVTEIGPI